MIDLNGRWPERLRSAGRILIAIEFVFAVVVIIYSGWHVLPDVLSGSPPALPVRFEASCDSVQATLPCHVSTEELTPGRYRIATDVAASRMTLLLSPNLSAAGARVLAVRSAALKSLRIEMGTGGRDAAPISTARLADVKVRALAPLAEGGAITTLSFVPEEPGETADAPLALDEFGLYATPEGLLNDARALFPSIPAGVFYQTLVPGAIARLCLLTMVGAFFLPARILRRANPFLLGVVCLSICVLELAILFSPYSWQDLRSFYAGGPLLELPGSNLNEGLWQATRLLQGEGLTIVRGVVAWERMPGYALFCSVAGILFGHRTLVDFAIATVALHVLFYSAAVALCAWVAGKLWSPPVVWTLGLLIALLPKQLGYTQGDSLIIPIALLMLTALCLRLKAMDEHRAVGLGLDVFVHLTFALWFSIRPDVLPGWLVVSVFLHWRHWRRLLLPLAMVLSIGISWGAYKAKYTHEFAPTTSGVGSSLICGLWEVPSRFAMPCSDEWYSGWIQAHTNFDPKSQAASGFATREAIRVWLTYPGHFVIMTYHKFLRCVDGDLWPGFPTDLQRSLFRIIPRPPIVLVLLTGLALCIAVGYDRRTVLLLAWPLALDAPFFWVMFASEGRFYGAVGVALLVAALPPLLERGFYLSLAARPWRTAGVVACAGLFAVCRWPLHDWLLRNDAFHYWSPLLDPAHSLLIGMK